MLSLAKMLSAANVFEISDIQQDETQALVNQSIGLAAKFTLPARAGSHTVFCWRQWLGPGIASAQVQFLLPAMIDLVSGLLAVLHSTQYLWITSHYQKKEARAAAWSRTSGQNHISRCPGVAYCEESSWPESGPSRLMHVVESVIKSTRPLLPNVRSLLRSEL
jgi:hypothetical protein